MGSYGKTLFKLDFHGMKRCLSLCMQGHMEQLIPLSRRTRWMIVGGLVLVVATLQYGTFRMGYNQGWEEGAATPQQKVILQSDEKAMKNLAGFMSESASGPDSLASLVKNRKERLSWIHDPVLLRDVSWGLGRDLLTQGRTDDALELLNELMPADAPLPDAARWAPRADLTASLLMRENRPVEAASFFQRAAAGYTEAAQAPRKIKALQAAGVALLADNRQDEAFKVLDIARAQAKSLDGANGRMVQARILSMMARIERTRGNADRSKALFEEALKLWPEQDGNGGSDLGSARVCMGEAFLESGRLDEAEKMLQTGLQNLRKNDADIGFTLDALRGLARIRSSQGDYEEALANLYRAEGVAMGRVDVKNNFWPCLYDQIGWTHLLRSKPAEAIGCFSRTVDFTTCPEAQVQSCEGLGRAYLEQGDPVKALLYLKQAAQLRESKFPGETVSLGRVFKNLGMAYDLSGNTPEALEAYAKAFDYLKTTPENPLFMETALCKAYAHMEKEQWQMAVDTFLAVIPLMEGEKRSENLKNMAKCYDGLNMRDKADACWKDAGFPRISVPSRRLRR